MADPRTELLTWKAEPGTLAPEDMGRWYKGEHFNHLPDKSSLGVETILKGWTPDRPIINRTTRTLAFGSCFASYFILWLADNGFNQGAPTSPYDGLIRHNLFPESPAVVAQQFRWACGEARTEDFLWVTSDKQEFTATEAIRLAFRSRLLSTDALILTLGLSEVWYDKTTSEPLWRALPEKLYDPARHVFRVETFDATKHHIRTIVRLRDAHFPNMKLIFTVSPVALKATFRPVSAVTASSVSKALIRCSVDEVLREQWDRVNSDLFYFPSYEIVRDLSTDPFEHDNRHVKPAVVSRVIDAFVKHYCAL